MFDPKSVAQLRRALLQWYRTHGRHELPWRHTRDPYAILVSELMLQQTQVATVLSYYREWLRRFPDVHSLAAASEADVLHAWQGLGYYARARNLHAAAKQIASCGWPDDLAQLPGVGRYTANAVASFAFDKPLPIVEANTTRLFARLLNLQERVDSAPGQEQLWSLAAKLVPRVNARSWNSALMDLGALICTPGVPNCSSCPVRSYCTAVSPAALPLKRARAELRLLDEHHGFSTRRDQVLLEQSSDRWRGMWMLPRLTSPPAAAPLLHRSHFPFTHHRIALHVFAIPTRRATAAQRWFPLHELHTIPLPSPHRRALTAVLQQHSTSRRLPRKVQA
jgi:A/G-specific adenine glycosylase